MGKRHDRRKLRERVAAQDFILRINVFTQTVGPTKTEVQAFATSKDYQDLKFHKGPPHIELRGAAESFAAALADFAGDTWSPGKSGSVDPALLRSFQNSAVNLFEQIFSHSDKELHKTFREDLRFYLEQSTLSLITFDSDLPGIPFDALHYGKDGAPFDAERFIGNRAPVVHGPRSGGRARIDPDLPASIGLLGTREVAAVGRRDAQSIYSVFEELTGLHPAWEGTPLRDLNNKCMEIADLAALFRALGEFRSVWHVTSHMERNAGQPYFVLDNGLEVRPTSLDPTQEEARAFLGEPLVFLNICESAGSGHISGSNFPDALHAMKAGGVIATHCLVNQRFATEFARRFYRLAFAPETDASGDRRSVGESLFQARRDSLRQDGSLASLCYSFHANSDFWLPDVPEQNFISTEGAVHGVA